MLLSRRTLCASGVMLALPVRWAHASEPPASGPLSSGEVDNLLRQHKVPGAGLAILDARGSISAYGYGTARPSTPVSTVTRFQAASISKTLNALLTLTLVRDGLMELDGPVNRHLKSFRLSGSDADRVTPRMLLSHTAGTSVRGFAGYERGQPLPTLKQILVGERPANNSAIAVTAPLGRYVYSGGGITVLQQMIIDVTGEPYQAAAESRVLAPLAMSHSSLGQPPSEPIEGSLAHAHSLDGQPVPKGYNIYPELAAAGLWTTPADVCRMMRGVALSVVGGPGALLPEPLAKQMVGRVDGPSGLGIFINSDGTIGHGGRNRGFSALYRLELSSGKGVAVMTNIHDAEPALLALIERGFAHGA
ncbi:MAG: serine hydrolase domain-containing protein [Hyphomicrobiaceae bacterium]|nr:serine hydrolase domain-containing protein [Hyphomicrobiaceae bacterium]